MNGAGPFLLFMPTPRRAVSLLCPNNKYIYLKTLLFGFLGARYITWDCTEWRRSRMRHCWYTCQLVWIILSIHSSLLSSYCYTNSTAPSLFFFLWIPVVLLHSHKGGRVYCWLIFWCDYAKRTGCISALRGKKTIKGYCGGSGKI